MTTPSTTFAFRLLAGSLKGREQENVFISPASVEIALSMAVNGARGATKADMLRTLGYSERQSIRDLNKAKAELLAALREPGAMVELSVANALWAREGVEFNKQFIAKNRKFYQAQVDVLDFAAADAALSAVNGWVNQATRGKIETILESLSPNAVLYLMNAVYFKGSWSRAFDRRLTADRPFYGPDGSQCSQPAMLQSGRFRHLRGDGFQSVALPYGDGRVSMHVFLPDRGYDYASFLSTLTPDNWHDWMGRYSEGEGDLILPRFKLACDCDLKPALAAMGMGSAFAGNRADFGALCPRNRLTISEVRHKTFVDVNEDGTEAAAVTSIGFECLSVAVGARFAMVVDRPFVCAIVDNATGSILFLGSVVAPR